LERYGVVVMKIDDVTVIGFPNSETWAKLYEKFSNHIVKSLNNHYCLADREDAVEEAFHKLMHKKDCDAYGENVPETEAAWVNAIYWQASAYLSHLKDRAVRHAKYVEYTAEVLADVFSCGHQGEEMDAEISERALISALEMLRNEQDISRRDLAIYLSLQRNGEAAGAIAKRYRITANNAYQIKFRIGRIIRKHGPRCFERALRKESAYGHLLLVA